MTSEIHIRNAGISDIPFVIEAIVQAEKGNGENISYCKLFNIKETEFQEVLKKILEAGINNFEFSLSNFKVAIVNRKQVGAYGAWLEGLDGIPSGMLKISAFRSFLNKENMLHFKANSTVTDEISIKRLPGTLQFESIYILNDYRGKNIGNLLVQSVINDLMIKHPVVSLAQVQLIKQNSLSLQAHTKYGFQIIEEKTSSNPEIFDFFSGNTRVLMEKKLR
jgi:ribosomal protein S18 acetylase RimI-like enzyme